MQIGIGWLGLSEREVMESTFWALGQGYEGKIDQMKMLRDAFGFGAKAEDGEAEGKRIPPTLENFRALLAPYEAKGRRRAKRR